MKIAAVCVTFNRPEALQLTLAGLVHQTKVPHMIVVVDNGDSPFPSVDHGTIELVHHRSGSNLGYGAGLAIGMEIASKRLDPDYFFLLDDDSPPSKEAVRDSVAVAVSEANVGMVGVRARGRRSLFRTSPVIVGATAPPQEAFTMLVDCALVTRETVNRVGFPRSDLFMMCEDIDYSVRVRESGLRLLCRGGHGSDPMQLGSAADWRHYYQSRNLFRLAIEWRSAWWLCFAVRREVVILAALTRRRRWTAVRYRLRGFRDATRSRMGRTVDPMQG